MRVAVVGLGTVGTGVIRLLDANRDLIARRAGRPIEVRAVNARDRNRDRGVDISRFDWVDDMMELARRDDIVLATGNNINWFAALEVGVLRG